MDFISLLRGINVAGKNSIKMDDLKLLYESLGLKNIVTYIQSGNVVFTSNIKNRNNLKMMMEKAIHKKYGYDIAVQLRTKNEMVSIVEKYPFVSVDAKQEGSKILVTLLSSSPADNLVLKLQNDVKAPEKLVVDGDSIYLYCPNGYGRSKLTNKYIELTLGLSATTRNWKTMSKLCDLL
jgi:uncharacterized protein (DUF1697 family)